MNTPLRLLHLEDSEGDYALIVRALTSGGYAVQGLRIETETALRAALEMAAWDVVLCDCGMPQLSAAVAIKLVRESGHDLPVILVSGSIGEAAAVAFIKAGAHDYVMKDHLTRLASVVERAIVEARLRQERRQVEATMRLQATALEAAANAIMITDREGVIQWVNPAWIAMTGYPAEEAIGQTPRILKSGRHDAAYYEKFWQTILRGEIVRSEMINRRKDGSLYPEFQTITPVRDPHGQITHFIGIKSDITERKQLEAALADQLDELKERNADLDRFNRVAVDRELRMIELKEQVNALQARLGEPPRYTVQADEPSADATPGLPGKPNAAP